MLTPIALFAYNRQNHLTGVINALQQCKESKASALHIFIDGPKVNASQQELDAILKVRAYAKSITGFQSIEIIEQASNLGLSNSIVNGISYVLQSHTRVIVIEDDIVVGTDFLNFMNAALTQYEHESKVAGISGYSFPINEKQAFFSRTGSCWGWGTYKRVWDDFIKLRPNLSLEDIQTNELELFNVYGTVYSSMFLQTKQGILQSWAVEFYLYYFSKKQFFLMPGINLITNAGFDGTGTHPTKSNFLTDHNPVGQVSKPSFPSQIIENPVIRKKIQSLYHQGYSKPSRLSTFICKIKNVILANENNNH